MSWKVVLSVVCAALAATGLSAQVIDEANPGLEFSFSTPGARSLAMGGAFLGLADDATAAYTNPAGLTTLHSSEVSIEGRGWSYTTVYPDTGHIDGPPTGTGIDTVEGVVYGESTRDTAGVSYLSYVHAGDGWALSAYRHQLADYEAGFESFGTYYGDADAGTLSRLFPVVTDLKLEIANYGVSFAYRFSEQFSVGVGASYYDYSFRSELQRYDVASGFGSEPGEVFGPPLYEPENLFSVYEASGDDSDWGFNIGMLWKPTSKLWVGGVYRGGPSFDLTYTGECGPADPEYCSFTSSDFLTTGALNVPNVYGLGVAFRPNDALVVTFDWDRVEYSRLAEGFVTSPGLESQLPYFHVDDGDEWHAGLEYVFLSMKNPLALRLGAWLDPVHVIQYSGDWTSLEALWSATNAMGDEWHYSGGLGMAFAGGKLQVDLAVDLSERVDTGSLSAVYRF